MQRCRNLGWCRAAEHLVDGRAARLGEVVVVERGGVPAVRSDVRVANLVQLQGVGRGTWGVGHGAWGTGRWAWSMRRGAWSVGCGAWGAGYRV